MINKNYLVDYLSNSREYDNLEKRIIELEDAIQTCDDCIEALENSSKDFTNSLDNLARQRNLLNLERIELAIRKNKIEKDMLLFEIDQSTTSE